MAKTYAIQYRECETNYAPAGKWKDAERHIPTLEEAERLLRNYKSQRGFYYDFALCIEFD
jgi:hypothetical protein